MVKDFFRGFGYTIGKILAFIFIGLASAFILSRVDISKIPFKQLIMKSIFIDTYAQSVSGSTYFYTQQGYTNGGGMPTGYSTYISDGYPFPMSTYHYVGKVDTTNYLYTAIKQIYVNITSFTFSTSNTYIIKINFAKGTYLLHSNNTGWGANIFDNLTFCSHTSSSNNLSTCAISWSFPSSSSAVATIYYSPTVSSNNAIFQIGDTSRANSIIFYNVSSDYIQGIKIDSIDVSLDSSGNGDIIQNQNQNTQIIINNQNNNTTQITNSIDDINDTLTDTTQPNNQDFVDDMNDLKPSLTPITDLLNMPYNLVNRYLTGLNGSCSSINLGSLYGTNLILPCIDLEDILGSSLWSVIDILFVGMMCLSVGELLIHDFNSLLTLNDEFEETYTPRHQKRGGY